MQSDATARSDGVPVSDESATRALPRRMHAAEHAARSDAAATRSVSMQSDGNARSDGASVSNESATPSVGSA